MLNNSPQLEIPKGNILVVDDNPTNLDVLTTMLTKHGYKVRPTLNGMMAISAAGLAKPDLVLLDINMPEMNGYEVCEHFKSDVETRDIPIIFISALDETMDKIRAFKVGGVDYVTKPFQMEEVLVRVEAQLTLFRQRIELENLREKDRLYFEEINRLKDQFLYSVTHDMKNPLAVINLYLDLIGGLDEVKTNNKAVGYLNKIRNGAGQMLDMVADLLDLAKIGTGMAIVRSAVTVNDLLIGCLKNFEILAQRKAITLHFSPCGDDSAQIYGDARRIVQIINNLLSNAIKYTPEGGDVELNCWLDKETVVLEVVDNGLGIPDEDLPYIFDKFYRVNREDYLASEGTGLGLAIVKALVEQHNGHIEVMSQVGEGTKFSVYLPRE